MIKTLKKPRSPIQKLWLMNLISKAKEKSHCVQVESTASRSSSALVSSLTTNFVCGIAAVSSAVVMSTHLITNRMRFYFFRSKCVVNMSSACHFPTRGGMQCKIVRRSLRFPRSKFENFTGYPWCLLGHFGLVKD